MKDLEQLTRHPSVSIAQEALVALRLFRSARDVQMLAQDTIKNPRYHDDFSGSKACIQFLADGDEEALNARASHHAAFANASEFMLGIIKLSDGDALAARKHFVNSVDTGYVGGWDYELARGYLARMDADPNWPPWLAQPKTKAPE